MFFDVLTYRKIYITHNGTRHLVYCVKHFPKTILVEPKSGCFFVQYWKTPKKRGENRQRAFRKLPDVYSLFRALIQTMASTKLKRIPTLENLKSDCQDSNLKINAVRRLTISEIESAQKPLAQSLEKLDRARTVELKEAKGQMELAILFRDSKNRLNIGMVCARLVAVQNRLRERVENILYWLSRYAEWAEAISIFLEFHKRFLPGLEKRLCLIAEKEISENCRAGHDQLTIQRLNAACRDVERLMHFGGWRLWAHQCQKDLREAYDLISKKNYAKTITVVKKIIQAVRLKLIQYQLHEFLLKIDIDNINGTLDCPAYKNTAINIATEIAAIDELGFRTLIKDDLLSLLITFQALLEESPLDIGALKNTLRKAYQKI